MTYNYSRSRADFIGLSKIFEVIETNYYYNKNRSDLACNREREKAVWYVDSLITTETFAYLRNTGNDRYVLGFWLIPVRCGKVGSTCVTQLCLYMVSYYKKTKVRADRKESTGEDYDNPLENQL